MWKPAVGFSIEHGVAERVADGDGFAAAGRIPIEQIERDFVHVAVGQIEIDGEVAVRVVSRSDSRGCAQRRFGARADRWWQADQVYWLRR